MTRTLLACTVLLAACDPLFGSPKDGRQPCADSAACPVGQYCALVEPRACWDDPAPPRVTGVTVRCGGAPCLRDGVLTVEASVSDDQALGPVTVALDLDGGVREVAMAPVGGALHRATLDLADWPFPALEAAVVATVKAVDGARQVTAVAAQAGQRPVVTRVRGAVGLAVGAVVVPTAPALLADGTVLVGGSTGHLYTVAPGADTATESVASLGAPIVHPPAVGQDAIWVAAGNRLFAVSADLAGVLNGAGYDTGGGISGAPALTAAAQEVAFVGSAGGRLAAVMANAVANGFVAKSVATDAFTTGAVLPSDGQAFAATNSELPAEATLRAYAYDGAFAPGPAGPVGQAVTAPLALAANGAVWSASSEFASSTLHQTNPDGSAGPSIPLGASPGGGPIVLANGDVAICVGAELRRYTAAGAAAWSAPTALSGAGLTPIALAAPGGAATLLVPTRSGTVDAVRAADGALLWSASLTVNVELREGTVRRAPAARTSTAWFTSSDGRLHGLVVDGALDPAAPWPKAWHDPRNTSNLAAAP